MTNRFPGNRGLRLLGEAACIAFALWIAFSVASAGLLSPASDQPAASVPPSLDPAPKRAAPTDGPRRRTVRDYAWWNFVSREGAFQGTEGLAPAPPPIPPDAASIPAGSGNPGEPTSGGASDPSTPDQNAAHPRRILVRFKPGVDRASQAAVHGLVQPRRVLEELSLSPAAVVGRTRTGTSAGGGALRVGPGVPAAADIAVVEVETGDVERTLAAYTARGEVLYAEPDYVWRLPEDADGNGVSQGGTNGSGVGPVREGAGGGGAQLGSQTRQEAGVRGSTSGGVIPDDPDFALQWGLRNTGQTINGDVGVPGADLRAGG
ncbi:MAG: hypothetical protein HY763_00690, partial [Planctomycetes bacterium]|nr:hypothetical protein [Planctomycetota bacterium]